MHDMALSAIDQFSKISEKERAKKEKDQAERRSKREAKRKKVEEMNKRVGKELTEEEKRDQEIRDLRQKEKDEDTTWSHDRAELQMIKGAVLEEKGDYEAAIEHYKSHEGKLRDRLRIDQRVAGMLLRLGRFAEAEVVFRRLLTRNAENYAYHRGLQLAVLGQMNGNASNDEGKETAAAAAGGGGGGGGGASPSFAHADKAFCVRGFGLGAYSGLATPADTARLTADQRSKLLSVYDELVKASPRADAPKVSKNLCLSLLICVCVCVCVCPLYCASCV